MYSILKIIFFPSTLLPLLLSIRLPLLSVYQLVGLQLLQHLLLVRLQLVIDPSLHPFRSFCLHLLKLLLWRPIVLPNSLLGGGLYRTDKRLQLTDLMRMRMKGGDEEQG